MGVQSKTSPLAALPLNHRRNAFAILLVSVVLARSGHILDLDGVVDTLSLKAWREARKQRRDERRRRQMETPLYVYICIYAECLVKLTKKGTLQPSRRRW